MYVLLRGNGSPREILSELSEYVLMNTSQNALVLLQNHISLLVCVKPIVLRMFDLMAYIIVFIIVPSTYYVVTDTIHI